MTSTHDMLSLLAKELHLILFGQDSAIILCQGDTSGHVHSMSGISSSWCIVQPSMTLFEMDETVTSKMYYLSVTRLFYHKWGTSADLSCVFTAYFHWWVHDCNEQMLAFGTLSMQWVRCQYHRQAVYCEGWKTGVRRLFWSKVSSSMRSESKIVLLRHSRVVL